MALSVVGVETKLAHKGQWAEVAGELARTTCGSVIGMRLFGWAMQLVLSSQTADKIKAMLADLHHKSVTLARVDSLMAELVKEVQCMAAINTLPPKRKVIVSRRGVALYRSP